LLRYASAACRAALAAGSLLARHAGSPKTVQTKRSHIDLVTEIDREAERRVYAILHRAEPAFGFLGEEHGSRHEGADCRWIVDPLDGTNNFVHGFPFFGVSIGLERRGAMIVGVIYDPLRRELFVATKGGGARMNGRPIRVSPTGRLAKSLLSTGFSTTFLAHDQPYLNWFRALQRCSHGVRRMGSTVLCLAAIAAGRLEGFYERDLWPWDMAAGLLLVAEAGGRVSGFDGLPPDLAKGQLVATNGAIHAELLRALRQSGRGP
jgi:myo-inositol-1(or 4)-monophosphatase